MTTKKQTHNAARQRMKGKIRLQEGLQQQQKAAVKLAIVIVSRQVAAASRGVRGVNMAH